MASIYDIPNWSGGVTASKNNVYFYTSRYFYSLEDSNTETPALGASKWGGHTTFSSKTVPHFFWVPSYSPSISSEPAVRSIKFGDGYEQRTPESISSSLISISLSFDKRNENEATAIAHFLHARGGHQAFVFLPPKPYSTPRKFVCRKWDLSVEFEGSYSVKATFEEVVE